MKLACLLLSEEEAEEEIVQVAETGKTLRLTRRANKKNAVQVRFDQLLEGPDFSSCSCISSKAISSVVQGENAAVVRCGNDSFFRLQSLPHLSSIIHTLFQQTAQTHQGSVQMSFIQISPDAVWDMLNDSRRPKQKFHEKETFVQIASAKHAIHLCQMATEKPTPTGFSQAHCVVSFVITSKSSMNSSPYSAKLYFIDICGSYKIGLFNEEIPASNEDQIGHLQTDEFLTKNYGAVIRGNFDTYFLLCIRKELSFYQQTIQLLLYGCKVKEVVNSPMVNQEIKDVTMLAELHEKDTDNLQIAEAFKVKCNPKEIVDKIYDSEASVLPGQNERSTLKDSLLYENFSSSINGFFQKNFCALRKSIESNNVHIFREVLEPFIFEDIAHDFEFIAQHSLKKLRELLCIDPNSVFPNVCFPIENAVATLLKKMQSERAIKENCARRIAELQKRASDQKLLFEQKIRELKQQLQNQSSVTKPNKICNTCNRKYDRTKLEHCKIASFSSRLDIAINEAKNIVSIKDAQIENLNHRIEEQVQQILMNDGISKKLKVNTEQLEKSYEDLSVKLRHCLLDKDSVEKKYEISNTNTKRLEEEIFSLKSNLSTLLSKLDECFFKFLKKKPTNLRFDIFDENEEKIEEICSQISSQKFYAGVALAASHRSILRLEHELQAQKHLHSMSKAELIQSFQDEVDRLASSHEEAMKEVKAHEKHSIARAIMHCKRAYKDRMAQKLLDEKHQYEVKMNELSNRQNATILELQGKHEVNLTEIQQLRDVVVKYQSLKEVVVDQHAISRTSELLKAVAIANESETKAKEKVKELQLQVRQLKVANEQTLGEINKRKRENWWLTYVLEIAENQNQKLLRTANVRSTDGGSKILSSCENKENLFSSETYPDGYRTDIKYNTVHSLS